MLRRPGADIRRTTLTRITFGWSQISPEAASQSAIWRRILACHVRIQRGWILD